MNPARRTLDAFRRSSSAISLVIVLGLLVMALSSAYYILAYKPSEFLEQPGAQEYKNAVENVGRMDDWARTQYYWSHNLRVAGLYVAGTPAYLSFPSLLLGGYFTGMNLSYWYHFAGAGVFLAFVAGIFVHGVLELTGIFIVAAIALRAAWALWKGMGHMAAVAKRSGNLWTWGFSREEKRELRRHKGEVKEFLVDFLLVAGVGAFLIFLAAPIEAYVSPEIFWNFMTMPLLAVVFLAVVAFLYFSVVVWGIRGVRKNMGATYKDLKFVFKRRWRPAQLSILMFVVFSIMVLISFLT